MARKLNSLFTKTEPEPITPAPAAAASTSDTAALDQAPEQETAKKKLKPQSVYLNKSELKYIQEIADQYGESRHGVLQYAVKELIRQYKRGKKFRKNNLGQLDR